MRVGVGLAPNLASFMVYYEQVNDFEKGWSCMSLVIPDDILRAANISAGELRREIALLLFQQDKLTLGQCRVGGKRYGGDKNEQQ